MLKRFAHFLTYHNAVPLTVAVVLVGASGTYAANNPEVFYEATTEVVSIDNTYIANVNLNSFTPYTQIIDVREDEEFYFVTYTVSTIELVDAIWQDVETTHTLRVRKSRLGQYGDLGIYVTEQLKQVIDTELTRLRQTQAIERTSITQKQLATTYSGLIGSRLDATVDTIPGYQPKVRPPQPKLTELRLALPGPIQPMTDAPLPRPPSAEMSEVIPPSLDENNIQPEDSNLGNYPEETEANIPSGGGGDNSDSGGDLTNENNNETNDTPLPYLQLLGEAKVTLVVGNNYSDFGVAFIDAGNLNPIVQRYVNGELVNKVVIETTVPTEYIIDYLLVHEGMVYDTKQRIVKIIEAPIEILEEDTMSTTSESETAGATDSGAETDATDVEETGVNENAPISTSEDLAIDATSSEGGGDNEESTMETSENSSGSTIDEGSFSDSNDTPDVTNDTTTATSSGV